MYRLSHRCLAILQSTFFFFMLLCYRRELGERLGIRTPWRSIRTAVSPRTDEYGSSYSSLWLGVSYVTYRKRKSCWKRSRLGRRTGSNSYRRSTGRRLGSIAMSPIVWDWHNRIFQWCSAYLMMQVLTSDLQVFGGQQRELLIEISTRIHRFDSRPIW